MPWESGSHGLESVTAAKVKVVLSEKVPAGQTVTVQYSVTGGTPNGGAVDFTLADGTLTFNAGDIAKEISIAVVNDDVQELFETIQLTLANPVGAALGAKTVHTYTIVDDEWGLIKTKTAAGANYAKSQTKRMGQELKPTLGKGVKVGVVEGVGPGGTAGVNPALTTLGDRLKKSLDFRNVNLPVGADPANSSNYGRSAPVRAEPEPEGVAVDGLRLTIEASSRQTRANLGKDETKVSLTARLVCDDPSDRKIPQVHTFDNRLDVSGAIQYVIRSDTIGPEEEASGTMSTALRAVNGGCGEEVTACTFPPTPRSASRTRSGCPRSGRAGIGPR